MGATCKSLAMLQNKDDKMPKCSRRTGFTNIPPTMQCVKHLVVLIELPDGSHGRKTKGPTMLQTEDGRMSNYSRRTGFTTINAIQHGLP